MFCWPDTHLIASVPIADDSEQSHIEREKNHQEEKENEGEEKREGTRSRSSSTSSEDYIIILPDCFDTSRPLGESMYRYMAHRCCSGGSNGSSQTVEAVSL